MHAMAHRSGPMLPGDGEQGPFACMPHCPAHRHAAGSNCAPPPFYPTPCSGKKFPTLVKRFDAEQNLQKYEPYFVQSKNFP
jgi:hypothetical protein